MKIIWDETNSSTEKVYNECKEHFINNEALKKPSIIPTDDAFMIALLSSYYIAWMQK